MSRAIIANERTLVTAGEQTPRGREVLAILRGEFCDFWRDVLGLDIDREDFARRTFRQWLRESVAGITIPAVPLAAIIEASAHLDLTPEQRQALRARVEKYNEALVEIVRAKEPAE